MPSISTTIGRSARPRACPKSNGVSRLLGELAEKIEMGDSGGQQLRGIAAAATISKIGVGSVWNACMETLRLFPDRAAAADGDIELAHQWHRHRRKAKPNAPPVTISGIERVARFAGVGLPIRMLVIV